MCSKRGTMKMVLKFPTIIYKSTRESAFTCTPLYSPMVICKVCYVNEVRNSLPPLILNIFSSTGYSIKIVFILTTVSGLRLQDICYRRLSYRLRTGHFITNSSRVLVKEKDKKVFLGGNPVLPDLAAKTFKLLVLSRHILKISQKWLPCGLFIKRGETLRYICLIGIHRPNRLAIFLFYPLRGCMCFNFRFFHRVKTKR